MLANIHKEISVDPIIRRDEPHYEIYKSSQQITSVNYASETNSNNQLVWSNIVPQSGSFLDRKFLMNFTARFTLTQTNATGGSPPTFPGGVIGGVCALRKLPVQTNANSITLSLNGGNFVVNGLDQLEPLTRFGFGKNYENTDWSIVPAMGDYAEYDTTYNTALNPLAGPYDNPVQIPRGAIVPTIISDTGGVAVLEYSWSEYLLVPPLNFHKSNHHGFYGVTSIILTITLGDFGRMLSYDNVNGTPLASITGTFNNQSQYLSLRYLNPIVPIPLDSQRLYGYSSILSYSTDTPSIGAGSSLQYTTNNIQLAGIPNRVFIFARRRDADRTPFQADTYAYINNMQVFFGTRAAILSTYTEQQLYEELSAKNGFNYPFQLCKQSLGSVFCLEFGRDIPTDVMEAPGLPGKYNFYVTVNLKNLYSTAAIFSIFVVPIYDGIVTIQNGTISSNINLLSPGDIVEAEISRQQLLADPINEQEFMEGGDFLGTVKRFGKGAASAARSAIGFYKKHKDVIDPALLNALEIGKSVGLTAMELLPVLLGGGLSKEQAYTQLKKHGYSDLEIKAAGLVGGCNGSGLVGGRLISEPKDLLVPKARRTLADRT